MQAYDLEDTMMDKSSDKDSADEDRKAGYKTRDRMVFTCLTTMIKTDVQAG